MDLTPYVEHLRRELAAVAEAGDDTRALADRLAAPLDSATRLVLLNALSEAMSQVSRELAPGSVVLRLDGLAPEFVVTPPAPDTGRTGPRGSRRPAVPAPEDPRGHIRLRFADAPAYESAVAAFGPVPRDDDALALYVPTDGGIHAIRSVLDVLDRASIEAETLTVHTPDLDNVFRALTGGPPAGAPGPPPARDVPDDGT
ncbi:hypothetical protein ADK55_29960 [Streptomyces sp. WM4235]|uniref:hypothetical protein n=1 Tax=Streptomyces sp. WM4235 TaxID=1415551 RepID=UPI0006C0D4DA|nr:hypothetical protein [Streptomyces sp. WM4235]KOU41099.1 hypothetical protein ADK55_29960 [Streptomyces sp. WM4235]